MPRYTIAVDLTPAEDTILQERFQDSGRPTRVDVQKWGEDVIKRALAKPKKAPAKATVA